MLHRERRQRSYVLEHALEKLAEGGNNGGSCLLGLKGEPGTIKVASWAVVEALLDEIRA
jgi:hypothetical protein